MAQGSQDARHLPCHPLAHVPPGKSHQQRIADLRLGRVAGAAAILLASDGCRDAGQAETQTRNRQLEMNVVVLQVPPDPGDSLLVARARSLHVCLQHICGWEFQELPPEEGLDETLEEPEAHSHGLFL